MIESEGKPEQKFDAAFGTIFRISKCLQKLYIYFSIFNKAGKNVKTICACSKSTRPAKKYPSGDPIPLTKGKI